MKLTVRNKRIAAFVGVVIIGISIGIGFSLTNKEKFVTNLEKMVHEKNISSLQKSIVVGTEEVKVSKDEIKSLNSYLKSDNKINESFFADLKEQAVEKQQEEQTAKTFEIISKGRKWLIFPNYRLKVRPNYLTVSTDATNVIIKNQENKTIPYNKQKKQYGPIFPGMYDFKIELLSDMPKIETNYDKVVVWDKNKNLETYLAKSAEKDKQFTENLATVIDLFSDEYAAFMGGGFVDAENKALKDLSADLMEIRPLIESLYYEYKGITVNNDSIKLSQKNNQWTLNVMVFLDSNSYIESSLLPGNKMELEESKVYEYHLIYNKKGRKWEVDSRDEGFGKSTEWKNSTEIASPKPKVYTWKGEGEQLNSL